MCIIVAKEKGQKLPSKETLKTCFNHNSDGAGLMYVQDNKVVIDKGYMDFKSFYKRIKKLQKRFNSDLTDKAIVMHFRIGTSGENDKATTHPFPISNKSEDLKKTYFKTDLGMAHNGIISNFVYGKDLSDTQNFVKDFVSVFKELDKKFFLNENVMKLLEREANSKLCFLDNRENIYYIGNFIDDNGIKYSNSTYKEYKYTYKYDWNWESDNEWKEYKPTISKVKENQTIQEFIEKEIQYEVLEVGDTYEICGCLIEVKDKDYILIDSDYNLYELIEDKLSLIGTDVLVYDKYYNLKSFYWEWN